MFISKITRSYIEMSNALVKHAKLLSPAEKRVISACIAKSDGPIPAGQYKVKLTSEEYAATYKMKLDAAVEELITVSESLFTRYIHLIASKRKGIEAHKFRWVNSIQYFKAKGWIELVFSDDITPHFEMLTELFSKSLKQAHTLKSLYSWRLMELFQHSENGLVKISVDEFIAFMEAPQSYALDFFNLKSRVIDVAVNELNIKKQMNISYDTGKTGYRITNLVFKRTQNPEESE